MMVVRTAFLAKFLCVSLMIVGCTKSEPIYTKEQMLELVPKEGADRVEIVLAKDINDAVPCSNYGEGCLSAHRLRTHDLDFIAVEFQTTPEARAAAKRVRGWTTLNWLFDDVEGEPELMRWAERVFKAERFEPVKGRAADSPGKSAGSAAPSPATR